MYVSKALLVLLLTPIAIIGRPLFYISTTIDESIKGDWKGFFFLLIFVPLSPLLVLYASWELLSKPNDLCVLPIQSIFVALFTGRNC